MLYTYSFKRQNQSAGTKCDVGGEGKGTSEDYGQIGK